MSPETLAQQRDRYRGWWQHEKQRADELANKLHELERRHESRQPERTEGKCSYRPNEDMAYDCGSIGFLHLGLPNQLLCGEHAHMLRLEQRLTELERRSKIERPMRPPNERRRTDMLG